MISRIPRRLAGSLAYAAVILLVPSIAFPQNEITFKAETNLVLVPVVVRDANGNAVGNLHKEDFQVFDKGKPVVVTQFAVEETSGQVAVDRSVPTGNSGQTKAAPVTIPDHFVALQFDDLHMKSGPGNIGDFADLVYSRDAALKFLDVLQPADRIAIFTTSNEVKLDFTSDRTRLREALLRIRPPFPKPAMGSACQVQRDIELQSRAVVMQAGDIVRRMASLPGRRTVVLISSGLVLYDVGACPWTLVPETMQLIGNAVRSRVVFNGLDARGLALSSGFSYQMFQAQMTYGTGGRFISDTNDLNGAVRRLAASPKYIYVLGFSPEPLKPDGSFHELKVKLASGAKLDLQARKGYWAPDAKELARRRDAPVTAEKTDVLRVDEAQSKALAEAIGVTAAAPKPPATPAGNREGTTPDETVTFKVQTELVEVPVVVRDRQGNAVGNLGKDDFRLFDKSKPQEITQFAVEDTTSRVAEDRSLPGTNQPPANAAAMTIPDHFVALQFDDLHMKSGLGSIGDFGDLVYSRDAALKFLDTLRPDDRVAIFATSGRVMLDFTLDRAKLKEALSKLSPIIPDPPLPDPCMTQLLIERESRAVVLQSADIVRRMASLPGQRTMVLISSGLVMYSPMGLGCAWSLVPETAQLIDKAVRSRVVINGLDARGLAIRSNLAFQEFQERVADGTGGRFITNNNDLAGAIRQMGATPKYIYVLGFSPEALKQDGSFHTLTVKLENGHKLDIQARKGYWAPDAKEMARRQNAPVAAEKTDALWVDEVQTKEISEAIGLQPAPTAVPAPPAVKPSGTEEVSTHDEPVTFKVQSNLVEVPVVVRDRQGHAIGNLSKDDFRVLDKGKRQEITKFSVQKATGAALPDGHGSAAGGSVAGGSVAGGSAAQGPPVLPSHFVAFVFDDVHIRFEDLPQVRAAVVKYLRSSLQPGDRVALYTTSGRNGADFTNHPEELNEPLLKITPSPIREPDLSSCGAYVSYFQAVQIDQQVGLQPQQADVSKCLALRVAVEEIGDFNIALQYIRDAYYSGLQESRAVLAVLKIVVQRMAQMPGQRSVVLVSPGFFVPPDLQNQSSALMELAIRSKVLIGAIDARGVWTIPTFDACQKGASASTMQDEAQFRQLDNEAATDELIALAEGTGGTANFNNDFDGGIRKAAVAPEYLYLLAFSPQNLKLDGSFHSLKVTLNSGEKGSLQARRGYWAPKHADDAVETSKQEIENAIFSRDEIHNLPVEMHTQVTKTGDDEKLNVITSVDLKLIHLRKADDRNRNDLTIVAAVFDANGNFVAGKQKILQLRLRDETVRVLEQRPPVTIDTNFDMKSGAYLVRLVVRDAEGQELTTENAGVQIP
jgi:VWFA-related protein